MDKREKTLNPKKIIDRYLNNITLWEKVADLKQWEINFIAGQRHVCKQILKCIRKDEIPTEWPTNESLLIILGLA